MNDKILLKHNKILAELRHKRERILSLPQEDKIDAILDSPHPAAIVHSFPEEDFYFLIHDIGLGNSVELIELASDKQLEYLIDMETWTKDRIDVKTTTLWLDLIFKANPDRFVKWFIKEKKEFLEFYLYKNLDIKIREDDHDASDFGDDYFTVDDVFYVKVLDAPTGKQKDYDLDDKSVMSIDKIRKTFLFKFLNRLSDIDHVLYQHVLLESFSLIPAETEEEAYRLRNFRLAEKGYLPFDEAFGIYKPLDPKDLSENRIKHILDSNDAQGSFASPLYPLKVLNKNNLFTDSLKNINSDHTIQQLQTEFAGLANKIIGADQKRITSKNDLENIVKKGSGYINIALEHLTDHNPNKNEYAKSLIQKYTLEHIFRIGYGLVLKLKWRADKWIKKSWFVKKGFSISFWGEERFGLLGGLLLKMPLYFDNYKTKSLYREFSSLNDIYHTEKALNEVIEIDNLLSLTNIKTDPYQGFITFENMLLTIWAKDFLFLNQNIKDNTTLTLDKFKKFFDNLWEDKKNNLKEPKKISIKMKEAFLNWLSMNTGKDIWYISSKLGHTLEELFTKIEAELGGVLTQDLDPRYINLFKIEL